MDEAGKMSIMVKRLLTLNQLEFGYSNVNMQHFDIVDLIRGVLTKSDILIKQKEVDLVFADSDPLYVWSDAFMAEEVFTNYFTNALNHVAGDKIIRINTEKTIELKPGKKIDCVVKADKELLKNGKIMVISSTPNNYLKPGFTYISSSETPSYDKRDATSQELGINSIFIDKSNIENEKPLYFSTVICLLN